MDSAGLLRHYSRNRLLVHALSNSAILISWGILGRMKTKVFLKRILFALILLSVIVAALGYWKLKSMGMFREPHYDTSAPQVPPLNRPALLVFNKSNGFIHKEAILAATKLIENLSVKNGWSIYQTDNAAIHNSQDLSRFDVVIWNNNTGDLLTRQQRQDFRRWIEQGGAWLGIHGAGGNRSYEWGWFRDTLIGAQFIGHTMSPQFQDAEVLVADPSLLTTHLPQPWLVEQEEWYGFAENPRSTGSKILLTLDEESYDTSETLFADTSMPDEHPIAWHHPVLKGKMIYTAIGHQAQTYANPHYQDFIEKSLQLLVDRTEDVD